ncbi:MAG: outer membrane beta-barrel protein [Bacteroidota bacterium]
MCSKQQLLFLLFLFPLSMWAQNWNISATVVDTSATPLSGTTIMLLQAQDSVLHTFGLSNADGSFNMKPIPPGNYLIQLSYLGYHKYVKALELGSEGGEMALGTIEMLPEGIVLEEVTIKGEVAPILIKGDTVEYNANAFGTQANDAVEDLLRKLPGIQVERDGSIRAHGKKVEKVLVEGKEFFGDDPKIATKNLPADAVDRVQVFDKKSEMAEFTGIDDGQEQKTINLALKEDKKKGVFGNITGGYGTEGRYSGKVNLNRFSSKLQFSALGMYNNINQQGFSVDEFMDFMGGIQGLMAMSGGGGGGSMRISLDPGQMGLPISNGLGTGFTDTGAGGMNFSYDFSKNTRLNMSYFYNGIENTSTRERIRQSIIPGSSYTSTENSDQVSRNDNHRINLSFRHKIDSSQQLIFRGSGRLMDSKSVFNSLNETRTIEQIIENSNARSNEVLRDLIGGNGRLSYRKRFRKAGRNISASLFASANDQIQMARLNSISQFLPGDPTKFFADSLDQQQDQSNQQLNYEATFSYIEPFGKGRYAGVHYTHSNYGTEVDRDVIDLLPEERRNLQLSNHYRRDYLYDRAGLSLRINRKKWQASSRLDLQQASLNGELISFSDTIRREFKSFLPSLYFSYDIGSAAQSIDLRYETSLRPPNIQQLQPIIDNTDPINVYQGNPDLLAEYRHSANLQFNFYNQFSFTSLFAFVSASMVQNQISQARTIDSLFRQVVMPINVDQGYDVTGNISFGTPLRFIKSRINLESRVIYSRTTLFINDIANDLDRTTETIEISLENRKKDKIDIAIGADLSFSQTRYSVSTNLNQNYLNQRYFLDISFQPNDKWSMKTGFDYAVYAGDAFQKQESIPLWQASLSRFILKNQRGEIKLSAFDLLNQNVGFSRTSEYNYLQEDRVLSLARYFLLSFTYNLSAIGGARPGGFQFIAR